MGLTETTGNYCSTAILGGETENLLWKQKPPTCFVIETSQLITLAVCCSYVSNLIGHRTINIPEIILGVHGLMGFTVRDSYYFSWLLARASSLLFSHVNLVCTPDYEKKKKTNKSQVSYNVKTP